MAGTSSVHSTNDKFPRIPLVCCGTPLVLLVSLGDVVKSVYFCCFLKLDARLDDSVGRRISGSQLSPAPSTAPSSAPQQRDAQDAAEGSEQRPGALPPWLTKWRPRGFVDDDDDDDEEEEEK